MNPRITIVGAGPVGSLLALTLARRGYEHLPVEADRQVLDSAVPMTGRMMHALDGARTFMRYGKDDSEFINSMSRGGLNLLLIEEAAKTGRVRFHFQQRLTAYDFDARLATFESGGAARTVAAEVIIGTDGSGSALRAAMPGAAVSQDVLSSGYKELTIPPLSGGGFRLEKNALHIWPRGHFMLIALPNQDGSFTCTLFLPFEGTTSFAHLRSADDIDEFFDGYFGDTVPLIPGLAAHFQAAPLGQMVTVKTAPWSHGTALLLGDAAHAIVPFFGQGMNAGFEDVTLLDELLGGQPGDDLGETFAAFAARRKPDTDAIAQLAIENFVEMRDKVADPTFLLHKAVESELQHRFPGQYLSRYQLVTFTRIPYAAALAAGKIQSEILGELCASASSAAEVDYLRAFVLVRSRLSPLLRAHGLLV
jgi:kynurenine 3-monooxygenase